MRGALAQPTRSAFSCGSSPQMRGAPQSRSDSLHWTRIIPADAGSTCWTLVHPQLGLDHPRRCGEHRHARDCFTLKHGSSPQMRGAQDAGRSGCERGGIIPADAGSTAAPVLVHAAMPDHPRRCGEHKLGKILIRVCTGSSPQMRGAQYEYDKTMPYHRIIPADAGSTFPFQCISGVYEDHPRRCGEHSGW